MSEHGLAQSAACDSGASHTDSWPRLRDRSTIAPGAKAEETSAATDQQSVDRMSGAALDRSTPPVCHLSRLSTDELQLALQFLDSHSRLATGRCCRSMRDAVRDPFAWRDASPFVVRSEHAANLVHSLLVHAPIALVLSAHGDAVRPDDLDCLTDLRVLDARDWPCDLQQWEQLLALPAAQRLHEVRMVWRTGDAVAMLSAACRLPAVRRLECGFAGSDPSTMRDPEFPHYYNDYLMPFSAAPALEELTLHQAGLGDCLAPLGACRPLSALTLLDAAMTADTFAALCASPGLRQLKSLALHGLSVGDSGDAAAQSLWADGFRALTQLHTLTLDCATMGDLSVLLAALAQSDHPQLKLLRVTLHPSDATDSAQMIPQVLQSLLHAEPQLRIDMVPHASSATPGS